MNQVQRGNHVKEISTGRQATVVFIHHQGTESHQEPWAKIMFNLGNQGVSFACRDLVELVPDYR